MNPQRFHIVFTFFIFSLRLFYALAKPLHCFVEYFVTCLIHLLDSSLIRYFVKYQNIVWFYKTFFCLLLPNTVFFSGEPRGSGWQVWSGFFGQRFRFSHLPSYAYPANLSTNIWEWEYKQYWYDDDHHYPTLLIMNISRSHSVHPALPFLAPPLSHPPLLKISKLFSMLVFAL